MIPIYIGYDSKEKEPFVTLIYSILKHAACPLAIIPLKKELFIEFYYRERHPLQSTEFSFTRFLVPYLNKYEGWAIYMDCDMLCMRNIQDLWNLRCSDYSVMVVPHNHVPEEQTKFLNQHQTKYYRKNWSSMMLFNCSKCSVLTPEMVQSADGLKLHQFGWLQYNEIGFLPENWNYLVQNEFYTGEEKLGLVHFTTGGPWFKEYQNVPYADEWYETRDEMLNDETIIYAN